MASGRNAGEPQPGAGGARSSPPTMPSGPDPGASHEVDRGRGHGLRMQHRFAGDGSRQEQVYEGRDNAVIEPTLDIDQATDLRRDPLVTHDGGTQRSIRRGDDGAKQGRHPQSVAPEEQRSRRRTGSNGERQPDAEQSHRLAGGGPKLPGVDPGRIGEEDQSQGHFGEGPHGRRVQVEIDDGGRAMGGQESEDHECDRSGDVPTLQAGGHDAPKGQAARDDCESSDAVFVGHGRSSSRPGCRGPQPRRVECQTRAFPGSRRSSRIGGADPRAEPYCPSRRSARAACAGPRWFEARGLGPDGGSP